MFESGAGLLHLARKSEKLMPRDAVGEAERVQWIIAALNSIAMVTVPWWFLEISGAKDNSPTDLIATPLAHLATLRPTRGWLPASQFHSADHLLADLSSL